MEAREWAPLVTLSTSCLLPDLICGAIPTNSQQVAVKCLEEGEPSLAVKHREGTGAEWERK